MSEDNNTDAENMDASTGAEEHTESFIESTEETEPLNGDAQDDEELFEGKAIFEDLTSSDEDHTDLSKASQLDFSDVEDDVECPFSLELRQRVVEGVLFVSDKPVGITTLVAAFGEVEDMRKAHIKEALEALEQNLIDTDRGFRLHLVDGGYQLRTAEDLKEFLQNTIKARSFRLTGPSLETLAMVAYKQPCTKSQIDEIRGVDSSHLIRALMDRNLLSFAGKSELPGKPMLYKTTSKFLEVFGLRNIKELPSLSEIEALLPNGIGEEEEEKETLSDLAGKLTESYDGSYSAGEEELGKINDQLSGISTETEFFEKEKEREKERKELEKAESIREALMVGEEVSTRDQNWLVRFDEKLKDEAAAEEENPKEDSLVHELEGLSVDSDAMGSVDFVEEDEDTPSDDYSATDATEEASSMEEAVSEDDLAEAEAAKLIADAQVNQDGEVNQDHEAIEGPGFDDEFEEPLASPTSEVDL